MPSLFQFPQARLGLIGGARAAGRGLGLAQPEPASADDEWFLRRQAERDAAQQALQAAATPPAPTALPQRHRVSPWRVLDRVLGGETITGGLDSERSRLQAEAMAPQAYAASQENERLARALGPEALLAYRLNPQKFGEGLGAQFSPQVIAQGGVQSVIGENRRIGAPSVREFGDRIAMTDPLTQQTTYTDQRPATFAEETGRINANNPVNVPANGRLVDPHSGAVVAEGVQRPDMVNVAPGGTAVAFDAAGQPINTYQSPVSRLQTPAVLKRADDIELQLTQDQNSINRVQGVLQRIQSGDIKLGPMENIGARILNATGNSNENSLGIADLRTTVEALRNSILQDANGVQTEGDAVRALNAILAGINDPQVVERGLQQFLTAKRNIAATRQRQLDRLRGESGTQGTPPLPPGFVLDQ